MKKIFGFIAAFAITNFGFAQGPAVTSWLQNTTQTGSYYMQGNSTAIDNGILVNCQKVEYSADFVFKSLPVKIPF